MQKDLIVRNCLYKKKVKITPWQHFMKDFGGSEVSVISYELVVKVF